MPASLVRPLCPLANFFTRFKPRAGERAKSSPARPIALNKFNKDKITRGKKKKKNVKKALAEIMKSGNVFDLVEGEKEGEVVVVGDKVEKEGERGGARSV